MKKGFYHIGVTIKIAAGLLAAVILLCSAGCSFITITSTDRPKNTEARETAQNTEAPTPLKYSVSFDENEVFETELDRQASERIDGIIRSAVGIMNTMEERLIGNPDSCTYVTSRTAKETLSDPLDIKIYEDVERCAEGYLDYYVDHHEYGKDMFYSVTKAIDALRIDRPELFLYCDMKGETDAYGTSYTLSYYMPNDWLSKVTEDKGAVKEAVDLYYKVVDRIIAKMPAGLDNYEKCCYFAIVISLSTKYDIVQDSLFDAYQAYNVLIKGKAVCKGYAEAMLELMRCAGIRCEIVTGEAPSEGRHAWNRVFVDGEPYYVDVTWYDNDNFLENFDDGKLNYLFMTEEELLISGYVPDPEETD